MIKKLRIPAFLIFLVAVFLFAHHVAKADDGGPNTVFWAENTKVNCVSVINPEAVGSNAFLVFDYSAKVGQERGKPWTIVEKGKCYEMDDGSEDMYLVKIVNGNEREQFSNYSVYKSTDSINQIFCKNNGCDPYNGKFPVTPMYFSGDAGVTTTAQENIHFTLDSNQLFPTKYDFGFPITSGSSMMPEEMKPLVNDPSFKSITNIYIDLAKQLNTTLQSCDNRTRVEKQYEVQANNGSPYLLNKNIVWRLSDNKDVIVQSFNSEINQNGGFTGYNKPDLLNEINIMGCKSAFSSFTQTHQTDFSEIDQLADEVLVKFPNATKSMGIDAPIIVRDPVDVSKIIAFANGGSASSVVTQAVPVADSTTLDEPTPDVKTNMLVHSPNPLVRTYVWLPIVALIGIIIFLASKKK